MLNKNNTLNVFSNVPISIVRSILLFINKIKSLLPLNLSRINKNYLVALIDSHIIHYPTPVTLTYARSFGSLAGICLVIQIISGIFLAMHYTPNIDLAFSSLEYIMRDVKNGWLIRYIHANGASMFFIVVYSYICRGLYYGSYMEPRELLWCSGIISFLLRMGTLIFGGTRTRNSVIPQNKLKACLAPKKASFFSKYRTIAGFRVSASSNKNNGIFLIQNRSYHRTTVKPAPEWLLGLGKFLGLVKAAPAAVAKSIWSSVTDPIIFWQIGFGVFSIVLVVASIVVIESAVVDHITLTNIINVYNQIVANPNFVDFLNTTYPNLNEFNECSVKLLTSKSLNKLSYAECEIVVKFCIYSKNHMIFGILIDTSNNMIL